MVDLQRRIQDFLFIRGRITFFGEKIFSSGAESYYFRFHKGQCPLCPTAGHDSVNW